MCIRDSVNTVDGAVVSVTTKGDANNANDGAIPVENVIGLCTGSVAGLGDFAMFLQTPVGIVVVIGIPVLLYIAYDVTRITLNNRRIKAAEAAKQAEKESEKDEEIRRLRELLAEKDGAAEQAEGEKSAERSSDSGEEAAEEGAPQGAAEGDPPEGTEESAPPAEK